MKAPQIVLGLSVAALSTPSAQAQLRPPSVPLVAHDPYFSVWSNTNNLTDSATNHWTGKTQALSSLIKIDGQTFRLMGDTPTALPVLAQTGVQVLPTRTIYTFAGSGVSVRLIFTSPLLPEDMELMSRPVTYVTWEVTATDGKTHNTSVYFDASAALAVNTPAQKVISSRTKAGSLTALKMGTDSQPILAKRGDDLRIDWGYAYVTAPPSGAQFALGPNDVVENSFVNGSKLAKDVTGPAQAVSESDAVAAVSLNFGKVGTRTVSRYAMIAYDDLYSIQFMGRNLRPYWRRNGTDANALLTKASREYEAISKRCADFDTVLMADMTTVGGAKYAQIGALSYREALAAQKIVADANGQPVSFSKENFSNGCIATVDLIYPAGPQMLALTPSLLKASLQPIMQYGASSRWKFPFAPHDLGTYPKANGQVYGGGEKTEDNQMPVEESGNLIILMAALSKVEGNTQFADQFWPTLTKWADYLADKGFDPESQLSTDDFAGHLAHNVNLSAKAIVALGAFSQMAGMHGDTAAQAKYGDLAKRFAGQWMESAKDGDRTKLAFDRPGTWSQKYNLVWDNLLGLNLFPKSLYESEMAFYKTKLNRYGLPLDSRREYTKLDWTIWTATLTGNKADFEAIINPVYTWANETTARVPMTDWYETVSGKQSGFQARSAIGGVFLPLLTNQAIWTKWASLDKNRPANWAPMPTPPTATEIVPTGENKADVIWKYTTERPAGDWFATNFDDSAWASGPAGFGGNGAPSVSSRTPWTTSDIYIRRTFESNGQLPAEAVIYGFHDEDAEVYINGKLIGKLEGYNTSYEGLLPVPAGAVKAGTNTIAVHVRQTSGGQGIDLGIATIK
ncbi:DUF4965 domain-containing protein [bacterium]|nr:MAG: DUF4965 domain-containing protein [bacterium]